MSSTERTLRRATISLSAAVALAALAFGGWYAASPRYTLHSMQQAALRGDADGFSEHVDFPELRASLKTQIRARLAAEAESSPPGSLRAIGIGLATGFVDQLVDSAVSPETVGLVLAATGQADGWAPTPGLESLSLLAASHLEIERQGLQRFRVGAAGKEGEPALLFRRDGLSWKLDGVDLPAAPQAPDI